MRDGAHRITKSYEIRALLKYGKRMQGQGFTVVVQETKHPYTRFGVLVRRGSRTSVERNRTKRVFRELVRERIRTLARPRDILIVVQPRAFPIDRKVLVDVFEAATHILSDQ